MQNASPTKESSDVGGAVNTEDRVDTPAMVLPEHAAPEAPAQKSIIALEVIFFYLHEAFEASRGWNLVLKHAGQVCALGACVDHHPSNVVLVCMATIMCLLAACTQLLTLVPSLDAWVMGM